MYDQHFQQSMDQPGMVANPARGQLNRGKSFLSCPRSLLRFFFRETESAVPSSVSLFILHTQAESGTYSKDSSSIPRRRPYNIPSTAIGSFPRLSDHSNAYQWRSLPRVPWSMASSNLGSSRNDCCLSRFHHGRFFYSPLLSHAHYWYIVCMYVLWSLHTT